MTSDYWKSEYDWGIPAAHPVGSKSRETVLSVLFDCGAQCQFSRVRITLSCSKSNRRAWQIRSLASSLLAVDHASPAENKPVAQNDHSLPICNIIFMANQCSDSLQSTSKANARYGELGLVENASPSDTVFESDHPLTQETQCVSVSFTSSSRLCTWMTHGVSSDPSLDRVAKVGRVVRVLPVSTSVRCGRAIYLPAEVLLFIFEHLRSPLTYRGWRRDVSSCALVCREWTCALSMLLIDFRSEGSQQGYPPEIASFASALVACPSLGLEIKYLSAHYLDKHPVWDPHPILPAGDLSPSFLNDLMSRQSDSRRSQFSKEFLIILRVARNLQALRLIPGKDLVVPPDDFVDALRGLTKLHTFQGRCPLTMKQFISCVAAWPSLKRLSVLHVHPPSQPTLPLASPSCCLSEIELMDVPIKDDELVCLVSASGATLERLRLNRISRLTNAGLRDILDAVCASLTHLHITATSFARDGSEAHALDDSITRMARLATLEIIPEVASERMLERRAKAFEQCTAPALSEVHLHLMVGRGSEDGGLVGAVKHSWLGWKVKSDYPPQVSTLRRTLW